MIPSLEHWKEEQLCDGLFMAEMGLPAAEIARHLGVATSTIIRAVERVNEQWGK
jgi:IS30 family transposase